MFEVSFCRVRGGVCRGLVCVAAVCSFGAGVAGADTGGSGVDRVELLSAPASSADRVFAPEFAKFVDDLGLSDALGDDLDPQDVRFARSVGDESFYVAPSKSGKRVCIVAAKNGESVVSCSSADAFTINEDISLASGRDDGLTRIVGVVPNSVDKVVSADGVASTVEGNVFVLEKVKSGKYTLNGPTLDKPITQVFQGVEQDNLTNSKLTDNSEVESSQQRSEREGVVTRGAQVTYADGGELGPRAVRSDSRRGTKSQHAIHAYDGFDHVRIWYERPFPQSHRVAVHEGKGSVATNQHESYATAYCQNAENKRTIMLNHCWYHF